MKHKIERRFIIIFTFIFLFLSKMDARIVSAAIPNDMNESIKESSYSIISIREVSTLSDTLSLRKSKNDGIPVTLEVKIDGKATPDKTFYYSKNDGGVKYAGTLKLKKIHYRDGCTYATYKGKIYKQ